MSKSLSINIIKLSSSKLASQVVAFAAAPIIARLFSPHDFGVRQIFVSIAKTLAIAACLRYELSIPLAKSEKETSASFALSLFFAIVLPLLALALVPMVKGNIAQWFKMPELKIFLWLLPMVIFMSGLGSSLRYWAAREGKFGAIAWSGFSVVLSSILIAILWALTIGSSSAGLLTGYLAGIGFGVLLLLLFLGRKLMSEIKNTDLSFKMLWTVAKFHKKLPIFNIWSALLSVSSSHLPSIILGLYFRAAIVGYYSLGLRLITGPTQLLCGSIGQVFYPSAAREYNETGDFSQILSNMFKRLVQIGVFPVLTLGLLGTPIFGFLFGEEWIEAGTYAQILSIWILCAFITSPFNTVFNILDRQGTGLVFAIGQTFGGILALVLGAKMGSPRIALAMFAIANAIGWSLMLCWILRSSGISLRWGASMFLKYTGLSCLLLLPASCSAWVWGNIFAALASLGFAIVLYIYVLYRFDASFRDLVLKILSRGILFSRLNRKEAFL